MKYFSVIKKHWGYSGMNLQNISKKNLIIPLVLPSLHVNAILTMQIYGQPSTTENRVVPMWEVSFPVS